jgi:hypothetical protein
MTTMQNVVILISIKKLSLEQAMGGHKVMRCQGSHIFQRTGSQMAVWLSEISDRNLPGG